MDEQERLVLSAALLKPEAALAAWREFRATVPLSEASPILMWAGGYIHENLSAAGYSDRYLWGIYQHNLIVNAELLKSTHECIADVSRSITVTRLKSFGRWGTREKLGSRPLADLDILIDPRSLKKTTVILSRHGFLPGLDTTMEEFWQRIVPQRGSWGFVNPSGKSIDIHWSLFDHLDQETNRRLLFERAASDQHGVIDEGVIDPALEIALLAIQQRLQFSSASHLLIEIRRLKERTDLNRVVEAGKKSHSLEWIYEAFDQLALILGTADPIVTQLNESRDSHPITPLQHDTQSEIDRKSLTKFVVVFGNRAKWKTWLLFVWWILGATTKAEQRLIRLFRCLSASRLREISPGLWRFDAKTRDSISPGWSYRMPGRNFIWTRFPEGRIAFSNAGKGHFELEVNVEWDEWARHPLQEVSLFVNGVKAQIIRKSTQQIRFQLKNQQEVLELSFRRNDRHHFSQPGIFREWYEQMLPISKITLTRIPSLLSKSGSGKRVG